MGTSGSTIVGIVTVIGIVDCVTKPAIIAQKRGELISSIDAMHDGSLVVSAFTGGQEKGNPGTLWKLVETAQ